MKRVIFNGKFLSALPSGVQRVASQLLRAFRQLVSETQASGFWLQCELIVPPGGPNAAWPDLPGMRVGRLTRSTAAEKLLEEIASASGCEVKANGAGVS